MKFESYMKACLFFSVFILFSLFIVPLSLAEQINNDLSKQGFSLESAENPGRSLQEKEGTSVEQTVTAVRQMEASYDVKIPLSERFNAVFFLEKPHITDFAGRDMGKNYNAMIGFQIILR